MGYLSRLSIDLLSTRTLDTKVSRKEVGLCSRSLVGTWHSDDLSSFAQDFMGRPREGPWVEKDFIWCSKSQSSYLLAAVRCKNNRCIRHTYKNS